MNKKTRGMKSPGVLPGQVGGVSGRMNRSPEFKQHKMERVNVKAKHMPAPGGRSKY